MEHIRGYPCFKAKTLIRQNEISENKHRCTVHLPYNQVQVQAGVNHFLQHEGAGREEHSGICPKIHCD